METDSQNELSESEIYALLANQRRRLVLRILEDFDTPLPLVELTELVSECESEDPSSDAIRVIHLSLYHSHLPKLRAAEVVDYDSDEGFVRPGSNFGVLVGVLSKEPPRSRSHLDP